MAKSYCDICHSYLNSGSVPMTPKQLLEEHNLKYHNKGKWEVTT